MNEGGFMRIAIFTTIAVMSAVSLSGCASLNEAECRQGDWASIGQMDGSNGYPMTRFQEHVEACTKFSVAPDQAAYSRARDIGLSSYCTPERGFTEGRTGNAYHGVCPPQSAGLFMTAYNDGRIVKDVADRRNAVASTLSSAQYRLEEIEGHIRDVQRVLDNRETSAAERDQRRNQLSDLRRDRERERDRMRDAERDLRRADREVDDVRRRFESRYTRW